MTDKDLLRVARGFRRGLLNGGSSASMCYMVSAPLQGLLAAFGLDTELVEGRVDGWDHVWLRLPDGRILDATADQFRRGPKVYLGPRPSGYRLKRRRGILLKARNRVETAPEGPTTN